MSTPALPEVDVTGVGDTYLLDVREQDEWDAGHAPHAVHIPLGEVPARAAEVPTDRVVHVVCKGGVRSAKAAEHLRALGVDAHNVTGGMLAWQAAGLEMHIHAGGQPTVA